jgi:serine/threonine-protein kinase
VSLETGSRLGPYEILASIGAGGMGEVYRARDTRLGRDVAIKVSAEQFSERFEREARAIAALNHPNLCTLHDVGPNYLVMELVDGPTLAERIKQGPIPLVEALASAAKIADALQAAHEKGIVHRDLKPANVKITRDGSVKVLDFGLAKNAESAASNTENSPTMTISPRAGMILGTAAYMAPEQARGKTVDRRADIWAFGAVLYEMLTGKQAFPGETGSDIIASVLAKEPDLDAAPAKVRRLLKKCLEKDRKQRLQAIGDWEMLLEEILAQDGPRRRVWPWAIGVGVLAAATAISSWIAWRASRPVDQPLMRFSVDLGPDAVRGARITAAISPDGMRLAFIARGPKGTSQLATRRLDQENAILLAGTDNAVDPFFSPDSQWIGFFADQKMKKVSVQGGAAVTLCTANSPRGASWGADGTIIFTPSQGAIGLSRVAEAGGAPQLVTTPRQGEYSHRWPQILPGGEAVLFTSTAASGDWENGFLEVLSLKSGQWKTVLRGAYFGRYLPTSDGMGHLLYVHEGTLFGVGFDPARNEVKGAPIPLVENISTSSSFGRGDYEFSRNGSLVYAGGITQHAPMALLDRNEKVQPAGPSGEYGYARFSPDGKRLALVSSVSSGDVYVYDREHDRLTRLTNANVNSTVAWIPDGQHIVTRAGSLLQILRADGAGAPQTLLETKGQATPYSISPDGKFLAYTENVADRRRDILVASLGGDPEHAQFGKAQVFVQTPRDDSAPAFSPDGKWIAYASEESGRFEVYVRPFPAPANGASPKQQVSVNGGNRPAWSQTAHELLFVAPDNLIMVASYKAAGQSFEVAKPQVWSNTPIFVPNPPMGWAFDLAPDGKHVIALLNQTSGEQKESVHVNVLLNFFDELRRRVPVAK